MAKRVAGWSGFNFFAFDLNETIVLQTADALLSTGLAELGFVYVNLDAGWLTCVGLTTVSILLVACRRRCRR